ncbi:hypothetical protein ANO11243_031290 [Dothideomycetidae sp. 11243]|nr:hypothetical protein ANO11243_031290 [fungal sp. No.11243]
MALLLVPSAAHSTVHKQTTSAPSAPGVPDPLRSRLALTTTLSPPSSSSESTSTAETSSTHPLESRLSRWRATQDATRFTMLARHYGAAEPVRRRLELADCAVGEWRPAALGAQGRSFGSPWASGSVATGAGVHADVLLGREAEFGWEDVFVDRPLDREVDFHTEMEARCGMNSW